MEHSGTHWRLQQRYGTQTDILEPYYDVVDDQETARNVHIQPARPIDDEREYIDRDLPRSSSAHSLSSVKAIDDSTIHPTYPPRKAPTKPAPTINRDLKPGRRKKQPAEQLQSWQRSGPPSRRCPPSPQFPLELVQQLNGLTLQENSRRQLEGGAVRVSKFKYHSQGSPLCRVPDNAKSSVDLEAQHMPEKEKEDFVNFPHGQDELPQTEVEFDQHNFAPMERAQSHWGDDCYIGPCSRPDAEHALHLFNKDGAFFIRDSSLNTISEPLVLSMYQERKVYHVKIRFIENCQKYALGTGQRSNEMFDSVADIIKFHSIFPIVLISGKNLSGSRWPENCVLTCAVSKEDVYRLLQ